MTHPTPFKYTRDGRFHKREKGRTNHLSAGGVRHMLKGGRARTAPGRIASVPKPDSEIVAPFQRRDGFAIYGSTPTRPYGHGSGTSPDLNM